MPLFCISHLLLLLLPLALSVLPQALSCGSQRPLAELGEDYAGVVQTDLDNAKERIAILQQNTSCPELRQRPRSCSPTDSTGLVSTIFNLTCQMAAVRLSVTHRLATSVLNSLGCTCSLKLTEEPKVKIEKRRTTTNNRKRQRKRRRESEKLCKVTAILRSMTRCYQMLSSRLGDT